jgi:hypothetical protein
MTPVTVLLEDWEHWCCGERRTTGDEVELRVHWTDGVLYETRHVMPGEQFEVITGRIAAIKWRAAIMRRDGELLQTVVGYEPGVSLTSTDGHDAIVDTGAFEFTLESVNGLTSP